MATKRGPPANPNFTGTSTPGKGMGICPKRSPTRMPINRTPTLGWSRRSTCEPSTDFTRSTLASVPVTSTLSPTRSGKSRSAKNSMPLRVMRVTLTPYNEDRWSCARVRPVTSSRVTTIRRLTYCSLSISCTLPSLSTVPNSCTTASESCSEQTRWSFIPI